MREFIGNPFQQEFEEDDDLDEFEFEDNVFRIVEAERLMGPPEDVEEEHDDDDDVVDAIRVPDIEDDDEDDPDYIFENNDGFDSDESQEFEFEDVPQYNLRVYSSDDEEDDELDYVTFPVSENHTIDIDTMDTANKPTTQESSNSTNSEQELPTHAPTEEEDWD